MRGLFLCIILLTVVTLYSCDNVATYPISAPDKQLMDDRILGRWKIVEDTNTYNFYEIRKRNDPGQYHIRFWDRGGTSPTYEGDMHFSKIRGQLFLNLPYAEERLINKGYFFIKIFDINADFSKATGAMIADTTMRRFKNSRQLKKYIEQHINDPRFYSDTAHFYMMK